MTQYVSVVCQPGDICLCASSLLIWRRWSQPIDA